MQTSGPSGPPPCQTTLAQPSGYGLLSSVARCISLMTRTVDFEISPGEVIRVEGLQRDRRRGNDLRVTLPDGRAAVAEGRRPSEPGWVVVLDDKSDFTGGLNLAESLAVLMGWRIAMEEEPEWLDRFLAALG
jgi:hypothetical protein